MNFSPLSLPSRNSLIPIRYLSLLINHSLYWDSYHIYIYIWFSCPTFLSSIPPSPHQKSCIFNNFWLISLIPSFWLVLFSSPSISAFFSSIVLVRVPKLRKPPQGWIGETFLVWPDAPTSYLWLVEVSPSPRTALGNNLILRLRQISTHKSRICSGMMTL